MPTTTGAKSCRSRHIEPIQVQRAVSAPQLPEAGQVLKITMTDLADEQRWSLQGQLIGQWAAEFQSTWREARHAGDTRKCIIELIEVTSIDRNGEAVLAEIMSQGVEFIARDVYTKYLLQNLQSELERSRMKEEQK